MKGAKEPNDFVKLAGTIGGLFLVIVVVVILFAKESLVFVLNSAVWAFVVLGIALGGFMSKTTKRRR